MKITIIGAGIAGLTAAIILEQRGFEVVVFEAATTFKKVGAGITLASNAMQIYKRIGLYATIATAGNYINRLAVLDSQLKLLSKADLTSLEEKHQVTAIAIHRASLHAVLLKQLKNTAVHLGKRLANVEQKEGKVYISFEDGSTYETAILIGADGIHSKVREAILGHSQLRNAKQHCWRGIAKVALLEEVTRQLTDYKTSLNELWGKGSRFGFVRINPDEIYWFALTNQKKDHTIALDKRDIHFLFKNYDPLIAKIIGATSANEILYNQMIDLKPLKTWHNQQICLLGDAAHATTPNMGQGACQAIESAYVLATCLSKTSNPIAAFSQFEKIRKKKAIQIVNRSWQIGKMAQLERSWKIQLRNQLMRSIPNKITEKQFTGIYELNY